MEISDRSDKTFRKIPLLMQWDERWGNLNYGGKPLRANGCAPTCLSMIISGLTGDESCTPYRVACFSEESGYYVPDVGTAWGLMTDGAARLGLQAEEGSASAEYIRADLSPETPMICAVGPGDFTKAGHFIVLAGLDEAGNVIVNDPNSRANSAKRWEIKKLLPQILHVWRYSARPSHGAYSMGNAAGYDECRAEYPEGLYQQLYAYAKPDASSEILEIGHGTGLATLPLLRDGYSVTGIEINREYYEFSAKRFREYPNFHSRNADFIALPLAADTLDLIYCATAFHWLPQEEAYRKIMDCLKPGGTVALFWNHIYPFQAEDEVNRLNLELHRKYMSPSWEPVRYSVRNQTCTDELARYGFKDIRMYIFERVRRLTPDQYINMMSCFQVISRLDSDTRERFFEEESAMLKEYGGINVYETIPLYLGRKPALKECQGKQPAE